MEWHFNHENWVWGYNTLSLWLPLQYSKKKGIELKTIFKLRIGKYFGFVIVRCSANNDRYAVLKFTDEILTKEQDG